MTAFGDVFRTMATFGLFMIVIPVVAFSILIIIDYLKGGDDR